MKGGKKKILLIGPYPPPEGGVSIHLQRLMRKSASHPGLEFAVFDVGKNIFVDQNENRSGLFSALRYFLTCSIVHLHISHPAKAIIGRIVKLFGKKLFYTHHNSRMSDDPSTQKIMKLCDKNIYVYNDERYPGRLVIPSYIPIDNYSSVPPEIENLMAGRKVVVTLGTSPVSQNNSDDVYGFDIILDSIKKITSEEKLIFLFIDVNGTFEKRYKQSLTEIQDAIGSSVDLRYLSQGIDFPALLKRADVYIRATKSDGDSIAVRESLDAGTRVIASDCAIRPEGCILFKTGNVNDLAQRISDAIGTGKHAYPQKDYSNSLFAIYQAK